MLLKDYYFDDKKVSIESFKDLGTQVIIYFRDEESNNYSLTFDDIILARFLNVNTNLKSRSDFIKQIRVNFSQKIINPGPFNDRNFEFTLPIPEEWRVSAKEVVDRLEYKNLLSTFGLHYVRGLSTQLLYQLLLIRTYLRKMLSMNKPIVEQRLKQIDTKPSLLLIDEEFDDTEGE